MALEKVKKFFDLYGMKEKVLEFNVSSATVVLAAQALECEEARIAKTLSFDMGKRTVLVVTAGDMKIDNSKFKHHFSAKAKMLPFDDVERKVGHAVGGVCPFAVNEGVEIWLDESLKRFETVFPACGSSNSAIELTIPELEKYSSPKGWADVCKQV